MFSSVSNFFVSILVEFLGLELRWSGLLTCCDDSGGNEVA